MTYFSSVAETGLHRSQIPARGFSDNHVPDLICKGSISSAELETVVLRHLRALSWRIIISPALRVGSGLPRKHLIVQRGAASAESIT